MHGLPDEKTNANIAEAKSQAHTAVVERMLANVGDGEQPQAAGQYYAAHRDEIVGPEAVKLDSLLARKSAEGEAHQQGDAIVKSSLTLTDAVSHAQLITDPHVRTLTEERIRQNFRDQETALTQKRADAFARASKTVEDTGGNFHAVPLSDRDLLTPEENTALQNRATAIRNPKEVTNRDTQTRLKNWWASILTRVL